MWFSMTLWTLLASLICSTLASSSSSLHSGSFPDYDKSGSRGYSDPRWSNDYERDSKIGDLSPWSADTETLTRQILDSKSPDAAILSTLADQEEAGDEMKKKRESHSLSIVNPLDVLRQRLMLEMARRRMKENQDQIRENALILKNLGKRAAEDRTNYVRRIHVLNSDDFDV